MHTQAIMTLNNPTAFRNNFVFGFKVGLAIAWAAPFILAGGMFIITIIGAPIGLLLIHVGIMPMVRLQKNRLEATNKWKHRDRPLDTEEEIPWVI